MSPCSNQYPRNSASVCVFIGTRPGRRGFACIVECACGRDVFEYRMFKTKAKATTVLSSRTVLEVEDSPRGPHPWHAVSNRCPVYFSSPATRRLPCTTLALPPLPLTHYSLVPGMTYYMSGAWDVKPYSLNHRLI